MASAANPAPPAPQTEPAPLVTIPRTHLTRLQIGLEEYKGYKFVNVREYYMKENGDWRPSHKGITIKLHELKEVATALQTALATLPAESEGGDD